MSPLTRTLIAMLLALLGACGEEDPARGWLSRAQQAHREADEALAGGDTEAARRVLRSAAEAAVPSGVRARDARVVRQDLYYRLVRVELESGEPERARQWANRGLELGRSDDLFTANLLVGRGRAREALGNELEASRDYHEALKMNDRLLRRTLQGNTGGEEEH